MRVPQPSGVVCPKCNHVHTVRDDLDYTYFKCNLCGHEWSPRSSASEATKE